MSVGSNPNAAYMGGTGPCGPMRLIFSSVIKSWYISLNVKFGVKLKNTGNSTEFFLGGG